MAGQAPHSGESLLPLRRSGRPQQGPGSTHSCARERKRGLDGCSHGRGQVAVGIQQEVGDTVFIFTATVPEGHLCGGGGAAAEVPPAPVPP